MSKSMKVTGTMNILTSYFKKSVEDKSGGRSSLKSKKNPSLVDGSAESPNPKDKDDDEGMPFDKAVISFQDSPGKTSLKMDKRPSTTVPEEVVEEPPSPVLDEQNDTVVEFIGNQKRSALNPE